LLLFTNAIPFDQFDVEFEGKKFKEMLKDKMSRDLEDWSEGTKKMGEQKRFG